MDSVRAEELPAYLAASVADLDAHLSSIEKDAGPAKLGIVLTPLGADVQQLQLWWLDTGSRVSKDLLWDYCSLNISSSQAANVAGQLRASGRYEKVEQGPMQSIRVKPTDNVPLFDYHPQRFLALHHLGPVMAKVAQHCKRGFERGVMEAAMHAEVEVTRSSMAATRLRHRLRSKGRAHFGLVELAVFVADFCVFGRQIFDFPARLIELFRRTDVDDIALAALNLPYDGQYLYFGAQRDWSIDGWCPDGAYVSQLRHGDRRAFQFALTFAPPDRETYASPLEHQEPDYIIAVDHEQLGMGVGEAVELVLAERINTLKEQIAHGTPVLKEGIQEASPFLAQHGVVGVDASSRYAGEELPRMLALHEIWSKALKLVVNGLAYLSAYPDDVAQTWPDKAPSTLIGQLSEGTHKEKQRARSKLLGLGYSPVHICGQRFAAGPAHGGTSPSRHEPGADVGYTWVRGHWTHVAHGPQRTSRRLHWRMPFRRALPGSSAGDQHGHIYLVD